MSESKVEEIISVLYFIAGILCYIGDNHWVGLCFVIKGLFDLVSSIVLAVKESKLEVSE